MCGSLSDNEVGGVGGGEGNSVHHNSRIPGIFLYTCGCPCVFPSVTRKLEGWEEGKVTLCITTPTFLRHFYLPVGVRMWFPQRQGSWRGWRRGKVTLCITTPAFLGYFYIHVPVGVRVCFPQWQGSWRGGRREGDTVHHNSYTRQKKKCIQ